MCCISRVFSSKGHIASDPLPAAKKKTKHKLKYSSKFIKMLWVFREGSGDFFQSVQQHLTGQGHDVGAS